MTDEHWSNNEHMIYELGIGWDRLEVGLGLVWDLFDILIWYNDMIT